MGSLPTSVSHAGPIEALPGIGPKTAARLREHGIEAPLDLVLCLPIWAATLDDAREIESLGDEDLSPSAERIVAIRGVVRRVSVAFFRGRSTTRVSLASSDGRASLDLRYPYRAHAILALELREGEPIVAAGRLLRDGRGKRYLLAPKVARTGTTRVFLEYPDAVTKVRGAIDAAVELAEGCPIAPTVVSEACGIAPGLLREAHGGDPRALRDARVALAIAEATARRYLSAREPPPRAIAVPGVAEAADRLAAAMTLTFTVDQSRTIADVAADMSREVPMRRLALGDVGTGKTMVALAALLAAASAGLRATVFAPTVALAEQWHKVVLNARISMGMPFSLGLVTSATEALPQAFDVCVGTHALASRRAGSAALVVIDEPQRTGTALRSTLVDAAGMLSPHVLLLTATPLPRTLALALAPDDALTVSELGRRPLATAPTVTRIVPSAALDAALVGLDAEVRAGARVFVVGPRVARGAAGAPGLAEVAARVSKALPWATVAIAHGASADLSSVLEALREGRVDVLVASSVVEVGIDVPEATRMIVLEADRFGVGQLHQLRGRVGRGDLPGEMWLVPSEGAKAPGVRRIEAFVRTTSGAEVAHGDLRERGPGDRLGERQSGTSEAPIELPHEAISRAVARLLETDPELESPDARVFQRIVARARRGLVYEAAG
ncbi:MAG: DEAD/DEAH box helicase [Myxococcales bacterium]|nr:DEAD/DEAH box helicase [Myxococcales bacterium]